MIVPLGIDPDEAEIGEYASQVLDEEVPDAVVRKYRVEDGFVLVTIWQGRIHQVIYQTPARFIWSRIRRNRELMRFYGDGQAWIEDWPVDFGKSRKRADGYVRSLYSKLKDYITFMTVEFDGHRKEIRWGDFESE